LIKNVRFRLYPSLKTSNMDRYTLMSLHAMVNNQGGSGKAIAIQGICDTVEEYLGVHRDIFRRELVNNSAILDGALLMWQKKQNKVAQQFLNNEVTYEEVTEMDLHYVNLYYLYNEHVNEDVNEDVNDTPNVDSLPEEFVDFSHTKGVEEVTNNEEIIDDDQAYWDRYIALQNAQHKDDVAAYEAVMKAEYEYECDLERWRSYND